MPFIEGLGYGFAMVLFIGPVFFTLLRASLKHGTMGGVAVASGIIVSDIVVVVICITGAVKILDLEVNGKWIALMAGIILLAMGLKYLLSPSIDVALDAVPRTRDMASLFTSGFMVNFVNPFVFIVWIALSLHATSRFADESDQWTFMSAVLLGIFSTDISKAILAERLRRILAPNVLKWVFFAFGIVMIAFSIRAFLYGLTG